MKVHKSVWASIISLILCFTMFLGTTLAWFTDTVTNTNNRIVNGTLDVQLWMDKAWNGNYVDISGGEEGDIFSEATGNGVKWEPGKTEIVFLAVANKGNLALNYNIIIDVQDENATDGVNPADVLEYAIIDGWQASHYQLANVENWNTIANGYLVDEVQTGPLTTGKSLAAEKGALEENAVDYFALAVHMDEKAGNEYMGKELKIDVQVAAKQMASESDSISNQYDANAEYDAEKWHVPNLVAAYQNDFEETADRIWTVGDVAAAASYEAPEGFYVSDATRAADGDTYFNLKSGYEWAGHYFDMKNCPFKEGVEYTLSAKIRIREDENGKLPLYPFLRIDFYNIDSNSYQTSKFYLHTGDDNGAVAVENEWVEFNFTFIGPDVAETPYRNPRLSIYKTAGTGEAAAKTHGYGIVDIDDVKITYDAALQHGDPETDEAVFRAMLAEEAAVSQMVESSVLDVWGDREPIPNATNLLSDGNFAIGSVDVEGQSAWIAKDAFEKYGEWVNESRTGDESGALHLFYSEELQKNDVDLDGNGKKDGLWPWFYQEVNDATTDVVYTISYWYKIKEGTTGRPYIKIETFPDPSIPGADKMLYDQIDISPQDGTAGEAGVWHQVKKNFVITEGADRIRVLLRLWDDYADALIDDVEIYATKPDDMVSLETDFKFFYDDERGNTTFKATFLDEYFPEYAGATVDFKVYDGETLVWEKNDNSFDEGVATVEFPLSTMMKREVPYCVKVTLRDTAGNVLDEASDTIFVYARPEYLTADGVFMKNGEEPFYPVIGYHADLTDFDFGKSEEAGFTVMQLSNNLTTPERALEQLDLCERNGVMGLLCLYVNNIPAGHTNNIQWTIAVLSDERVVNHPALYGYLVSDEPFLRDPNAHMNMENSYRLIRQYDSKHPILAVEPAKNMEKTIRYVDILIGDFYRKATGGAVHAFTSQAVELAHGRPVYTLLEAYNYKESGMTTFPSPSDARNNMYQTLIAGASASGYFGISDGWWLDQYNKDPEKDGSKPLWEAVPDFWTALCEFGNVEAELAYDHFVFGKSPVFNQKIDSADYWYSSWVKDGSVYMVVMGMKAYDQAVNAEIPLTSTNGAVSIAGGTVEIIADGTTNNSVCNEATIENGVLKLDITGVDTVLLKITPDGAVDFSAVQ